MRYALLLLLLISSLVSAADRSRVLIVIGEQEYETKTTLPAFAEQELKNDFDVTIIHASEDDPNLFPGLAKELHSTDVLLLSVRRRTLPKADLQAVRKYLADGGSLVAIRTSSHAFALRKGEPPEGHAVWPKFDREALGGYYQNHHSNQGEDDPRTMVSIDEQATDHPLVANLLSEPVPVRCSLYRSAPLAKSATPLLWGTAVLPSKKGDKYAPLLTHREPVAWTFTRSDGGRTFYTSLGHKAEFGQPFFRTLLTRAVTWAAAEDDSDPEDAP